MLNLDLKVGMLSREEQFVLFFHVTNIWPNLKNS